MKPVPVVLYEDNELLRQSLSSLVQLNDRYELVGAFENVLKVKEQISQLAPEIILMDIDMPGMSGIEAVQIVRKVNPGLPILMLTVFDDNLHVFDAIRAGASGYLLKKHISNRLFDSMEDVLTGGAPMSPTVARMVIASMQKPTPSNPYQLTPREGEILTSLSQGNSYKLIASQLSISLDTVRTHIKKVYEKLHVHSQTEAVSKALQEKLV